MVRRAGFLGAMALLISFAVTSQFTTRTVTGAVTDKRGNPLGGAVVQVEDTITLMVRSYITDKDGQYHFTGLSNDVDFTLRARYRKYWSKPKTLSKFDSSAHPRIDFVIAIE
jgi:hypothetical protein